MTTKKNLIRKYPKNIVLKNIERKVLIERKQDIPLACIWITVGIS
jgi:hypothetical protein